MNVRLLLTLTLLVAALPAALVRAQNRSTEPVIGLQENRPTTYAIQGAEVWTEPGQRLANATIIVRDGLIEQVGTDLEIPAAAQQIDAAGKTIYPGFVNGYTERKLEVQDSSAGYWNKSVTPQRSALEGMAKADDEKYRQLGFVARLVAPASGQIKGTSALVLCGDGRTNELLVRDTVALHSSLTAARRREGYPGSPMGAVALARQAMYDADWYEKAWRAARANPKLPRPESNRALEALVELRERGVPLVVDTSNERYVHRADRLAREFSWPLIIRGSGREYRRLDDVVGTGRAIIVPLDFAKAPAVSTPADAAAATLASLMHWDIAPENPARLSAAGAEIALTTDGLDKLADFWKSLRRAVKRGLTEQAALAALTTTPARMFQAEPQLGTIAAGKPAHLVITSGNLFVDKKSRIEETWVSGRRYRVSKEQPSELAGRWQLDLPGLDISARVILKLGRQPKRGNSRLKLNDESLRLVTVESADPRVSIVFDGSQLEREGLVSLSLLAVSEISVGTELTGTGTWPDGNTFTCQATRLADEEVADEEKDEDEAEDDPDEEAARDDDNETAPSESDQPPPPEVGQDSIAPQDPQAEEKQPPAAEEDEPTSDDEADEDEEDDESEQADQPASYEVNYPLGAFGRDGFPAEASTVAFQNATVWTCGSAGILENATVVIDDGKIVAVGQEVEIPLGAAVVDASGLHLTPGIIDCHSHIATDGGVNEGTQAITAEVRIGDFMDADDISIYRQLAGGVTSSNILHGSANPIGGQNQVIKMRWGANGPGIKFRAAPPGIKFALGENVKQSNWGDDHTTRYPQTRMGVDEIHIDAFQRAITYRQQWERWRQDAAGLPPRVDLELEALAEVVEGKRWIHCHSYRQSEIMALMLTCDRFGITIGTFQHILEGYKVADEMAKRGIMGSAFSDWWAYKFEVYDAIPFAGALMHNAGVVVSYNSDDAEMGRRLNAEAAKAVRYGGVPPEEALKFVTLNAARQLRIEDHVGSIEPGKDADLVLWNAPPLSVYAICQQTWVDGRRMFDVQENDQLQQRDRERHAALVQKVLATKAPQRKPGDDDKDGDELWPRSDLYCHPHHVHDEH